MYYLHSDTVQPVGAFRFKTNRAMTLNVACKASNDGQNLTNSVTAQAGVAVTVNCAARAKELYNRRLEQPASCRHNLEPLAGDGERRGFAVIKR